MSLSFNQLHVLFEDEHYIIIDKPSGLIVNRSDTSGTTTLQDILEDRYRGIFDNKSDSDPVKDAFYRRGGIVHRLDKDTSGIIVAAKELDSFLFLQKQFQSKSVKKTYKALVLGNLVTENQVIKAPVGRLPWNRRKFGVIADGRQAETGIKTLKTYYFQDEYFTLVEASPFTGRTHQIRIHLKHIGFPLCGDVLYLGRKEYKKNALLMNRLFLHSEKIVFFHPEGKRIELTSKLPSDLRKIIDILESNGRK